MPCRRTIFICWGITPNHTITADRAIRHKLPADIFLVQQLYESAVPKTEKENEKCPLYGYQKAFDYIKKNGLCLEEDYPFCSGVKNVCDSKGVFTRPKSEDPKTLLDLEDKKKFPRHAVTVIGYGTENDVDYYLILNSWDVDWTDHGCAKIEKCLFSRFYYPITSNDPGYSPKNH